MGLKVLSLFDGMSCGQIALRELGIKVDAYYASEIAYEGEDIEDARTASRYEAEGICPATEVPEATLIWLLNAPQPRRKLTHEEIKADVVDPQSTRAAVFSGEFTASFS